MTRYQKHSWPGLAKFLARHGLTEAQWAAAIAEGKLWCSGCKDFRPESDFHVSLHAYQRQRQTYCKTCRDDQWRQRYKSEWYQRHKERCRLRMAARYRENVKASRRKAREWRKALSPSQRALYNRRRRLRDHYDLSLEQFDQMLAAQGGVCAVCKRPPAKGNLCVDHSHATEINRGLLCARCNQFLGYFENHRDLVPSLIAYLEKYA